MDRSSLFATALTALAITTVGCSSGGGSPTPASGSGGGSPPPPPAGSLQVLPATFDFGKVTAGNTPAPLEVTIANTNTGTAQVSVSSISLLQPTGSPFALIVNGGSRPCGSASPTLPAASSCTVQVSFQPQSDATFSSTLQINSNASNGTVFTLPITGTREMATAWTLRINQIDVATCPDTSATAYVSVIDQGGFPVTNLVTPNFTVTQGIPISGFTVSLAATTSPVAIAAALDHSASLTQQPVAFADMKSGFSTFFGSLRAGDEGAVINFDSEVALVQPWTTIKTDLQSVIAAPWDKGPNTRLYDAANLSVTETAKKTTFRRAAIIATDGVDDGSSVPLDTAISNAQTAKVPLFMVGVGSSINRTVLTRMAVETGGLFFEASTSQNLATIYNQLSSILYGNQYVVKFNRVLAAPGQVTIGASSAGLSANDTRPITPCPP